MYNVKRLEEQLQNQAYVVFSTVL